MESNDNKGKPDCPLFSLARALLMLTLLAAPLDFGADNVLGSTALLMLALLGFLLWIAGSVQQRMLRILWSPLYVPAVLVLLVGLIQFLAHLTLDAVATRDALLGLVSYLLFFFLAGQLFATASDKAWQWLGLTVVVYALLMSLFAILQFLSSPGFVYWVVKPKQGGWVFGPYVNHDHYAGLMEMLIPVGAAYGLFRPRDREGRGMLLFAVMLPIASLLLCGSRGGLISLFAEILLLSTILLPHAATRNRRPVAAATGLGVAAAALLFFWMAPSEIQKRLASVGNDTPGVALSYRLELALDSLRMVRDHPWLGTGLGSFETVYPQYQSAPTDLVADHAHNDYAEMLAETGLAGGVLVVIALAIFFRQAFRGLGPRLKRERGWIQSGAALGCCGLLVHSFVDFNLHIPANAAWFAVWVGLAVFPRRAQRWCLGGRRLYLSRCAPASAGHVPPDRPSFRIRELRRGAGDQQSPNSR